MNKLKEKKSQRKLHNSNIMTEIGSFVVMLFVVAILLLYIDYSHIIMTKIDLDNLTKNMLLTAEMYGGLTDNDMESFYQNLEALDIQRENIVDADFPTQKDKGQVIYGEKIEIKYTVKMASPVYERFSNSIFGSNVSPIIEIPIYGTTVSKW